MFVHLSVGNVISLVTGSQGQRLSTYSSFCIKIIVLILVGVLWNYYVYPVCKMEHIYYNYNNDSRSYALIPWSLFSCSTLIFQGWVSSAIISSCVVSLYLIRPKNFNDPIRAQYLNQHAAFSPSSIIGPEGHVIKCLRILIGLFVLKRVS